MKKIFSVLLLVWAAALLLTACKSNPESPASSGHSEGAGSAESASSAAEPLNPPGKLVFPNVPDYNKFFKITEESEKSVQSTGRNQKTLSEMTGLDIPAVVDSVIEKYGKYFLDYIPDYILKIAIAPRMGLPGLKQEEGNVSGITDDAAAKANEFLGNNGIEPLDIKDPEQNIAAFAIAAMLLHEKNEPDRYMLAVAFADACYEDDEINETAKKVTLYEFVAQFNHYLD